MATGPSNSFYRMLGLAVLFTAPAFGVLLVLALFGILPWPVALVGILVSFMGCAAVMIGYWRDALRLSDYLNRLESAGGKATRPTLKTRLGKTFAGVVDRLVGQWLRRDQDRARDLVIARGIVAGLEDPVLVLDEHQIVIEANAAAMRRFESLTLGRDITHFTRSSALLAAVNTALETGRVQTVEVARSVPVEQVFEVRLSLFPSLSDEEGIADDGRRPRLLLSYHDITSARRSEQMRADFVANASHELRTPLTSLVGFLETVRGPARDDAEARDRFLAIMEQQAGRMSRLIEDLLSLSRIEMDEHVLPTDDVHIADVLRTVVAAMDGKAKDRKITLTLRVDPGLGTVTGDADQLEQIFQNLVDNAIKYGRPETETLVEAKVGGKLRAGGGASLAISVKDQGEGIDKTHLPRLTERFYRVDPARSRAVGGTGLGLAIVKHIVARHRGRLSIDSARGQGTVVTIFLPMRENAAPMAAQ